MTFVLLAIPILIVIYIMTQSGKMVMTDPLQRARADEDLYQSLGVESGTEIISGINNPAPLYCPGCKTYEDMTIFRGDSAGREHAVNTWYEDHKPHFLPADNQTHLPDAPGS